MKEGALATLEAWSIRPEVAWYGSHVVRETAMWTSAAALQEQTAHALAWRVAPAKEKKSLGIFVPSNAIKGVDLDPSTLDH